MNLEDERRALLRGILEQPDDDTARLVYADWLEEHGESERAWLIRSDIAMSQAGGKSRMHVDVASHLTHARGRPWMFAELERFPTPRPSEVVYTRGFISDIELPCETFMLHAEAIFRAHPVTSVKLTCRAPSTGVFHRSNEPTWHLQDKRYWLWELTRDGWITSYQIPWLILLHMKNEVGALGHFQYLSEENAWHALSQACVFYGRKLAGLPPLPQPQPNNPSTLQQQP